MWLYCNQLGTGNTGIKADLGRTPLGVHQNGGNFGFIDGHAQTNSIKPIRDWWLATGGAVPTPQDPCAVDPSGEHSFTYPPGMNTARDVAGAEWWTPPWYPAGPIFDESSIN